MAKKDSKEDIITKVRDDFARKASWEQMQLFIALNAKLGEEYKEKFGEGFVWDNIPFNKRTFRGWLRPLIILSDCIVHGRWTYWLDIKASQKVEGKPIPQLNFLSPGDSKHNIAADMIKKCLNPPNAGKYGSYKVFTLFIDWLLYGFGSPLVKTLPPIDKELNEYWYRNFNGDLLLMFPADYWVTIASEMYSGKSFNANAFFPTPIQVVQLMTKMTFTDDSPEARERNKYETFYEPCCGSGVMVLCASNHTLRIYANDIDALMVKMCTLNCYFYAPWVVEMDDQTDQLLQSMAAKYEILKEVATDVSK